MTTRSVVKIKKTDGNVSTMKYFKPQTRTFLRTDRTKACLDTGNRRVIKGSTRVTQKGAKQQFKCEKRPHKKGEGEAAYQKRMDRNQASRYSYWKRKNEAASAQHNKEMDDMAKKFRAQNKRAEKKAYKKASNTVIYATAA